MKKILYIIVSIFMGLSAHAASYTTVTIDQISYRLYAETMEAHVYLNTNDVLTIANNRLELPESVTNEDKTYTVTEIEYFSSNNTVLELVTPKTMKKIASVRKGVKTLVLGEGVTTVSELHESTHCSHLL